MKILHNCFRTNLKLIFVLFLTSFGVLAKDWSLHEYSLRSQIERIREKEKKIEELAIEKDKVEDSKQLKPLLLEIDKEQKELKKMLLELAEEKRHVRFEHPELGMEFERKYQVYKVKTTEGSQSDSGTDGRLNEVKSKAMKIYRRDSSEQSESEGEHSGSATQTKTNPKTHQKTEKVKQIEKTKDNMFERPRLEK